MVKWDMFRILYYKYIPHMNTLKYNTKKDEVYNYWTVLENKYYKLESSNHRHAKCICKCGIKQLVRIDQLINNLNKSCLKCSIFTKRKWHKSIGDFSRSHFHSIKQQAKSRNLEFNISQEFLWNLFLKQDKKCKISGLDITLSNKLVKNHSDNQNISASVDRIDSNKGYTEDNVQWVHKYINIMKGALSDDTFISICNIISKYNINKEDNFDPSSIIGYMQRKQVYNNRKGATTND